MKRVLWIDASKGILILLTMLGHSLQYVLQGDHFESTLWNVIYSFHMPCFFALSGIFAHVKVDDLKTFGIIMWRRFRQLLIPMTCWQILLDFTLPHSNSTILRYLDCGDFWFLWALFFISAIWSIGCYISQVFRVNLFFVHLGISLILLSVLVLFDYRQHGFHYIAYYYPYYVLEYLVHRSSYIQKIKLPFLWCLFGLWFLLSLVWRMHSSPFYLNWLMFLPDTMLVTFNRYFVGSVAVIAMFGLSRHYLATNNNVMKILKFLGTSTLALYTIHVSLFVIGQRIGLNMFDIQFLEILQWFALFVVVSSIMVFFLRNNKWTAMFLLGKIN